MVRGAEEHSNIATVYEKLSANEREPWETRSAFARKANLHRILARLAASFPAAGEQAESDPEALLFSPLRLWMAGQAKRATEFTRLLSRCSRR
jgi:hypothetical protein